MHTFKKFIQYYKPYKGVFFLDMLSNLERISDHANNIVGYVADEGEE